MTHEAGIWIFGIIALVCLSVWLLCRRSKAVEDAVESAPFHYTQAYDAAQYSDNIATFTKARDHWSDYLTDKKSKKHAEEPAPVYYGSITVNDMIMFADDDAKPLHKGWQGWEGGECPVPDDTEVRVMLRDGFIYHEPNPRVLRWNHFEWPSDIVAWRVA